MAEPKWWWMIFVDPAKGEIAEDQVLGVAIVAAESREAAFTRATYLGVQADPNVQCHASPFTKEQWPFDEEITERFLDPEQAKKYL